MVSIIVSFIVIFMLTYFGYQYITNIDVDKLEYIMEKKLPILAVCFTVTCIIIVFIIVNF